MASTGVVINIKSSSLLNTFPWANGIAIASGRANIVETALEQSENRLSPAVGLLLRNVASRVDTSDRTEMFDPTIRGCASQMLGCDQHQWEGREEALNRLNIDTKRAYAHLLYVADLFCPYILLDILAGAYGLHPNNPSPNMSRLPIDTKGRRLGKTFECIGSWGKLIRELADLHRQVLSEPQTSDQLFPLRDAANEREASFIRGLQCIWSSSMGSRTAKHTKVITNVTLLASAVWWCSMGFDCIPTEEDMFYQCIEKRANILGVSPDSWKDFKKVPELKQLLTMMRNIFHTATCISPLVALVPTQLSLSGGIRRDHLVVHGVALGNEKPPLLKSTEDALWMAVVRIATGGNAWKEMGDFLSLAETYIAEDKAIDGWYSEYGTSNLRLLPGGQGSDTEDDGMDSSGNDTDDTESKGPTGKKTKKKGGKGKGRAKGKGKDKAAPEYSESDYDEKDKKKKKKIPRIEEIEDGDGTGRRLRSRKNDTGKRRAREPDLPIMFVVPAPPRKQNRVWVRTVLGEMKDADVGLEVHLHKAEPGSTPLAYEFKAWESNADSEHRLLSRIMRSVEQKCQNDHPPHQLSEAHEISYANQRSRIFVTTPEALDLLTATQVQEIFRDRHILVTGARSPATGFNRHELSRLGSLTAGRVVEVNSLKTGGTEHFGSLEELLPGHRGESWRGLNIPDIPMGGSNMPKPPSYNHLASDEEAWQQTRGLRGINSSLPFPGDSIIWANASTKDSTTWLRISDQGLGTAVTVAAGKKYWALAVPKESPSTARGKGDIGTLDDLGRGWTSGSACETRWDYEGVLLCPGDTLYMRPCTPHYSLTVEDAIVHGHYMFSSSTSQATLYGVVHTFILGLNVTNHSHDLMTLLRRMLAMWLVQYKEDSEFDRNVHPHVPDVLKVDGLKDIMAIGNLVDLGGVIDRRNYMTSGNSAKERVEMGSCRSMYRQLQSVLARKFTFRVGGEPILPLLVFRRSLVELAAAVVVLKEESESAYPKSATHSAARVKQKMLTHFQTNHPDLLPRLTRMIEERFKSLCWTGPELTISRRTDEDRFLLIRRQNTPAMFQNKKMQDFRDMPLYSCLTPPPDSSPESEEQDELQDSAELQGVHSGSHQGIQASSSAGQTPAQIASEGAATGGSQSIPASSSVDPTLALTAGEGPATAGRQLLTYIPCPPLQGAPSSTPGQNPEPHNKPPLLGQSSSDSPLPTFQTLSMGESVPPGEKDATMMDVAPTRDEQAAGSAPEKGKGKEREVDGGERDPGNESDAGSTAGAEMNVDPSGGGEGSGQGGIEVGEDDPPVDNKTWKRHLRNRQARDAALAIDKPTKHKPTKPKRKPSPAGAKPPAKKRRRRT